MKWITRYFKILLLILFISPVWSLEGKNHEPDYEHRALIQESINFYAVFLPPDYEAPENKDKKYPVCLILHGRGSTELMHGSLSNFLGRDGIIYLAPRAPYAYGKIFKENKTAGYTGYPTFPDDWGIPRDDHFPHEKIKEIEIEKLYTKWIANCLKDARQYYRINDEKAVIVGHSQGAHFAHRFAIDFSQDVKAYFAYAGYYTIPKDQKEAEILKDGEVFSVVAHYKSDRVVRVKNSQELSTYLKDNDVKHQSLIFEGGSHQFELKMRKEARKFVHYWCLNQEPPVLKWQGQVVVQGVAPNSQAEKLGIEKGDLLLSYDEIKISEIGGLIQAIRSTSKKEKIPLIIKRGKREMTFFVNKGSLGVYLEEE